MAHTKGGTYLVMEGPQFSTRAESNLYRSWGCDVIGMTNMPEAKLAREAEICYATVAMVTDYDCWHHDHRDVDIPSIIRVMTENAGKAQRLIARLARDFPKVHPACPYGLTACLIRPSLPRLISAIRIAVGEARRGCGAGFEVAVLSGKIEN